MAIQDIAEQDRVDEDTVLEAFEDEPRDKPNGEAARKVLSETLPARTDLNTQTTPEGAFEMDRAPTQDLPALEDERECADGYPPEEDDLLDELADLCEAVDIESMTAFRFDGEGFSVPSPQQNPMPLIQRLSQVLYDRCYCQRFDPDAVDETVLDETVLDETALNKTVADDDRVPGSFEDSASGEYLERLFAAIGGPGGRMVPGWQILAVDPQGRITASKNGLTRVFPIGHYALPGPQHRGRRVPYPAANAPRPGGQATVWLTRGSLQEQAGFFYVHSATLPDIWEPSALLRLYWNLTAEGAPQAVGRLADRLDRFRIPFQLKTLSAPEAYARRADGTVLFFQRRHYSIVARLSLDVLADLDRSHHRPETPLFTRRLAPGLALAENPGGSFGLHRCQALAEALWNAHHQGQSGTVGGQLTEVRRHLARRGIDLDTPHLNPKSAGNHLPICTEDGP